MILWKEAKQEEGKKKPSERTEDEIQWVNCHGCVGKKKIIYIVYRILVQKKIGALIKKLIIPKSECIPIHKTREREGGSEGRNSQPKQVSSL